MSRLQFFDLLCGQGERRWSPNTFKLAYALKYKQIPFDTVWLSYVDVADSHRRNGIKPHSADKMNPAPFTCPAIKHGNIAVQESNDIVDYLEKAFPDKPSLFPFSGSKTLSLAVQSLYKPLYPTVTKLIFPHMPAFLDSKSRSYFEETRSKRVGIPLDEYCTKEEDLECQNKLIKGIESTFQPLFAQEEGPFLSSQPIWGDFIIVGYLAWFKEVRPDVFLHLLQIPSMQKLWDAMQPYSE